MMKFSSNWRKRATFLRQASHQLCKPALYDHYTGQVMEVYVVIFIPECPLEVHAGGGRVPRVILVGV